MYHVSYIHDTYMIHCKARWYMLGGVGYTWYNTWYTTWYMYHLHGVVYIHDTHMIHAWYITWYMYHLQVLDTVSCLYHKLYHPLIHFFLLEIHWYKCIMCIMCVLQQARDDTYMIQTWYCIILTRWYMYQQMIRWYTMIHDDTVSSSAVSDFRDLIHYLIHYMIHDDTRTKDDTRWYTRDTEMILYQIGK